VLLRIPAKVHVALEGTTTTFDAATLSVNAQGALVVMKQSLTLNTRLVLEHGNTKERVACKVVRPSQGMPDGFHVAVEFDSPEPDFWRITFPPSDWSPSDP
jgi:hypothetical protein